jgi:hypothetical protein
LYDWAVANGVRFAWLTFDEGCGGQPGLLCGLRQRHQRFVAEVPCTFGGWLRLPALTDAGRWHGEPGRSAEPLLGSDTLLANQPWVAYRVQEGHKGPMVWEVKQSTLFPRRENADSGWPLRLMVARYTRERAQLQYSESKAAADVPLGDSFHRPRGADHGSRQRTAAVPRAVRDYPRLLARMQLPPLRQTRVDPSDIVQETLLCAHQRRDHCSGQTEAEFGARLHRWPGALVLASGGEDGTVRLWHLRTGRELLTLPPRQAGSVRAVAFAPDGSLLAAAFHNSLDRDGVALWRLAPSRRAARP